MRSVLSLGLALAVLFASSALVGCGSNEKTKIPDKPIDLPKAPTPAGGGGGNAPAGTAQ